MTVVTSTFSKSSGFCRPHKCVFKFVNSRQRLQKVKFSVFENTFSVWTEGQAEFKKVAFSNLSRVVCLFLGGSGRETARSLRLNVNINLVFSLVAIA